MRKVFERLLAVALGCFVLTTMLFFSCPAYSKNIESKEVNVWRKVSSDEFNPGEIISLDMSNGYSFCGGSILYIIVGDINSEDDIILVFPNGGYWDSPEPDPFLEELQNEFDSLEEYLKKNGSVEWKKK